MFDELNDVLVKAVKDTNDPEVRNNGVSLSLSMDFHPSVARLNLFFERIWKRGVPEHLGMVMKLARRVRVGRSGPRWSMVWVQIGRTTLETWAGIAPLHHILSQNQWFSNVTNEHLGALLLALAYRSHSGRAFLTSPLWELQLLGRLGGGTTQEPEEEPSSDRHQAHVRYNIKLPEEMRFSQRGELMGDWSNFLERQLVRRAKRTGKALKPIKMPRTFEDAEAKVAGLTDQDREIDTDLRRMEAFYEVFARSTKGRKAKLSRKLISETVTSILRRLAKCKDVQFEGQPIDVSDEPLMPALDTIPGQEGKLELSWKPEVKRFLDIGPGYVQDTGGSLRPLDKAFPAAMRPLLLEPLPKIPEEDVDRFIEKFALRSPVPLKLDAVSSGISAPDQVERRLMLSEEDGALCVEARFGYHKDGLSVEVKPRQQAPLVVFRTDEESKATFVERRHNEERQGVEALTAAIGRPLPAYLTDTDAYDFLVDMLPKLSEDWAVFGDQGLKKYKVSGGLSPGMSMDSGVDWFDVDVSFTARNGQRAKTGEVLKSWLEGKRYHRLGDGSVARLPKRWLARHGDALAELEELRNASGGRLGAYAAPLAEALLGEAEPDAQEVARKWRALARKLSDFDGIPDFAPRTKVKATLRKYQESGVRWLAFLRDTSLGGLLADDMGLGKTLQVLVTLADTHCDGQKRPSLVVAPASVVHNWALEAKRFTPSLKVHVHHGKGRKTKLPEVDLIVTSYNLMRLDAKLFGEAQLRYLVLDEAQHIKNPQSQVSRAARSLQADHRLALTGTPLENNLYDLWSIFQFVMPGFFGTQAAFTRRYVRPIHREQDADIMRAMRTRIRPFVLRRLKTEVADELPERQEQVLYCDLSPGQRKLYESIRETYRAGVMGSVADRGVGGSTIQILEALMRLRQSCCDARLLPMEEARQVKGSAKLELLYDTLTKTIDAGHRTLVFSQWPSLLKLARKGATERGWKWLYRDGSTRKRQSLVEAWNKPDGPPLFFISLKAGGSGLNLTGADHVIHLDPWWNPAVEDQATDRAHRIGQTRPVVAYKLVARDTVEEKILELQDRKRQLMESAVDSERMLVDMLTREDLEAVFDNQQPQTIQDAV